MYSLLPCKKKTFFSPILSWALSVSKFSFFTILSHFSPISNSKLPVILSALQTWAWTDTICCTVYRFSITQAYWHNKKSKQNESGNRKSGHCKLNLNSTTTAAGSRKVWQSTRCCVYCFWTPDDGRKKRLKHVEHFTEINKLFNVASYWLYLEI